MEFKGSCFLQQTKGNQHTGTVSLECVCFEPKIIFMMELILTQGFNLFPHSSFLDFSVMTE